jgi:hypothetical protein
MNEALLAVLTALVGALIWLVKAQTTRSDRLIEQRDAEVGRLIQSLEGAVAAFRAFETDEQQTHKLILDGQKKTVETQERILTELRNMNAKMSARPS